MDAPDPRTCDAITDEASECPPARRMRVRGGRANLAVSSNLHDAIPVTEAEIDLIMAALGDTIARILNPTESE